MKLIEADLNDYDDDSRITLTRGSMRDLEKYGIVLTNGLTLTFYTHDTDDDGNDDNLIFDGTVQFDEDNERWVATIDWNKFKHASDFSQLELEQLGEV